MFSQATFDTTSRFNNMISRFFHPGNLSAGKTVTLTLAAGHHASRVLRAKAGDTIILFNGEGGEFTAHIENIRKTVIHATIDQFNAVDRESTLTIKLIQAICVNEKMDMIIQKSVELGVTSIQPVATARSIVRLSEERAKKRLLHWQRVIISACEQCGRNFVPTIEPLVSLPDWVSHQTTDTADHLNVMLSPTSHDSIKQLSGPEPPKSLTLFVGPEGGLTTEEQLILQQVNFIALRFGKRILRTETAAFTAIAALQMYWGDF